MDEPFSGSTVGVLAKSMISVSDNVAADLLMDRLRFEAINAPAAELGLAQTHLGRKMLDFEARARGEENYTSARDMITLLSPVWEGEIFSPVSRRFALAALEGQQLDTKNHLKVAARHPRPAQDRGTGGQRTRRWHRHHPG